MASWWPFKKPMIVQAANHQKLVVNSTNPPSAKDYRKLGIRHGMWVYTPSGVGIITGLNGTVLEVMLTHQDGTNSLAVAHDAGTTRQARYHEIPESRKPELTRANALGYY